MPSSCRAHGGTPPSCGLTKYGLQAAQPALHPAFPCPIAGEEPARVAVHAPVLAQQGKRAGRQGDVAVPGPLAAVHVHELAGAVDVARLQVRALGHAQAEEVEGPEVGAVVKGTHGADEGSNPFDGAHVGNISAAAGDRAGAHHRSIRRHNLRAGLPNAPYEPGFRVANVLLDFGVRVQYCMFECSLSRVERRVLLQRLGALIDPVEDAVDAVPPLCRRCTRVVTVRFEAVFQVQTCP